MRALFVFTLNDVQSADRPLRTPEILQLGIAYISSLLKCHGHDTRLIVLSRVFEKQIGRLLDKTLGDWEPGVVCFYSVSSEYRFVNQIRGEIARRLPRARLIIGGPHASLDPQGCIPDYDAVCIGEGEHATLDYITQLEQGAEPSGIGNLWIRRGTEIQRNPQRPFFQNVDELPFPDRDIWSPWIAEEPSAKPTVLLGRGCPFQCTYCCHHAFRNLGSGAYVRFRTPANIVAEIDQLSRRFPHYREIYLEQETIGVKAKWSLELCDTLEAYNKTRQTPLTFGVNLAVTPTIDYDALFAGLKRANVRYVNMGLESGSERLRSQVLRRKYSNQDMFNAVDAARRNGLQVAMFNMIGLPTETPEEFEETIAVNRRCLPDWNYTSIFYPYPGTDLHRFCQENGLLKAADGGPVAIDMERSQATLDLPTFPRKQVQHAYEWFDYRVYQGHKPRYRLFAKVIRSKVKTRPRLNRFFRLLTRSPLGAGIQHIFNPFVERLSPVALDGQMAIPEVTPVAEPL